MEESVFALLFRYTEERRAALASYMLSGSPKDYTEYARAVAQYEAYTSMLEDLKELEKRFMDE